MGKQMKLLKQLYKLHGVFSVIKPRGVTTTELCNEISYQLQSECELSAGEDILVGHGGSLDSEASGVVAVGIGHGIKMLHLFLQGDMRYECEAELGVMTHSFDASGNVIKRMPYDHVTLDALNERLQEFTGNIKQRPPGFSLPRSKRHTRYQNKDEADWSDIRNIQVHSIQCTSFSPPYFNLDIQIGAGSYVTSLVHDIGVALDTCAHVCALDRIKHGLFTYREALHIEQCSLHSIKNAIGRAKQKRSLVHL